MTRKKAQASCWLSPNGLLAGLMYIICPRVCCLFVLSAPGGRVK